MSRRRPLAVAVGAGLAVMIGIGGTTFAALGAWAWIDPWGAPVIEPSAEPAGATRGARGRATEGRVDVRERAGRVEALEREASVEVQRPDPDDAARVLREPSAPGDEVGARLNGRASGDPSSGATIETPERTHAATAAPELEHHPVHVEPPTRPATREDDRRGPWAPPRDALAPDPLPLSREPPVPTKPRGLREGADAP